MKNPNDPIANRTRDLPACSAVTSATSWLSGTRQYAKLCMVHYYSLLTYLLHGAVLLEKLTGLQLVKKFPAFYGTRRFITALTSARHLSLSWASSIRSIPPHPTSWRSIFILSSHLCLGLPSGFFPVRFPHQNPVHASPLPNTRYMPHPSHSSRFYNPHNIGWGVQIIKAPQCVVSSNPLLPHPSQAQIFSSTPYSQTPSAYVTPLMSATKFHSHTKQQATLKFCTS